MSDVRTFPAAYQRHLNAAISVALADIARDAAARAHGDAPVIRSGFDATAKGTAIVAVAAVPSEAEQIAESTWPDAPAATAVRFPGHDLSLERKAS